MIILSPSKGQDFSPMDRTLPWTLPEFSTQAQQLIDTLNQQDHESLADLLETSPALTRRSGELIRAFTTPHTPGNAKQALLAFSGEVYRSMAAVTFTTEALQYAQSQVRILSGLYGCLRPFDLIQPHRLEMGSKLLPPHGKNLSVFWRDLVTASLNRAIREEAQPLLINLASSEYSRTIHREQLQAPWLDIQFKEQKDGKLRTVALFAKRARGLMADFLLRNRVQDPAVMQRFTGGGYQFRRQESSATCWVFIRPMV
jgi:cytoplasmic iron level regulating protein YaaA (DUF328/UPF0246 family)